jgi:hypothetical protein
LSFSEAAEERAKSYEQGRVLLTQLVATARDLKLRCVGKNYDDANELFGGLESLLQQVQPTRNPLASCWLIFSLPAERARDPMRELCTQQAMQTVCGRRTSRIHRSLGAVLCTAPFKLWTPPFSQPQLVGVPCCVHTQSVREVFVTSFVQ